VLDVLFLNLMDLKKVIAELRDELESVDQVVAALEKLAELRSRRSATIETDELPPGRRRPRKRSAQRESAASAGGE
jgi:hypothetical protein